MCQNTNMLEELQSLLSRKRSKAWYADKLGITEQEVAELLEELRENKEIYSGMAQTKAPDNKSLTGYEVDYQQVIKHNFDKGNIEINTYYTTPPTPEQVIADHQIDENIWRLSAMWSKAKSKGWMVSALFSRKNIETEANFDKFKEYLDNYSSSYKPILEKEILRNEYYTRPSCALLSLPDFHLDKLTLDKVSIQEKVDNYKAVLQSLLYRAYKSHLIEEIVFVIGNDYFHTDTINNTTTKGTPLEVATSWNEAYELGFNLLVESITKLRQFCSTLHVVLIQGNHPRTKEYFLAHALEVYFKKDSNIIFNRSTENLKVHSYGETLMCFSHGDNINDKLPLSFATTFYKEWGECKYKEIILGDKHHNSEKLFRTQGESQGVRMRILPSLTGVDRWHKDNLFINSIQSGICLVYDKERGKISEFEERI